jgi:hypothetical protein
MINGEGKWERKSQEVYAEKGKGRVHHTLGPLFSGVRPRTSKMGVGVSFSGCGV